MDWRQAPQGGIGTSVGFESEAALIAICRIFASGYNAPAWKIATRSMAIPAPFHGRVLEM